jgi:SAM-dependent methyltransferase
MQPGHQADQPHPTDEPDVRPATAEEASDPRGMHAANRVAWDQAAEDYERRLAGSIERLRAGRSSLFPVELSLIGDLHGRSAHAVHVQCAGGEDTLSLWLAGAERVTGIDFSPRMLDLARRLAASVGAPATWIEADVLDLPHVLDGTADLVYTGRGSIMWVQDLDAWAAGLARLPRSGGRVVLFEGHPAEWLFEGDGHGGWMLTDYDYFAGPEASRGWSPAYIERLSLADGEQAWKFARAWTLGEVVTALLGSGLRVETVTEHPVDWFGGHRDVHPAERGRVPLSFSITATQP